MYVTDIFVPEECHTLVILGFLFTCLASIFVILRFITRVCLVRNVGADDGFVILANVSHCKSSQHALFANQHPQLGTMGFLIAVMQRKYGNDILQFTYSQIGIQKFVSVSDYHPTRSYSHQSSKLRLQV
jgi:hypothetical protein